MDAYVAVFAPDAVVHNPPGAPPSVGTAAICQTTQRLFAAYQEIWPTMDRVFIAGDGVDWAT